MSRPAGFSLVRFSPDPEEIERVNVALLLWGADAALRYREDFPKLRCIAGDSFSRPFLVEYLQFLAQRARELPPEESYVALNTVSAQVRVSRFRAAPRVREPAFLDALVERYLAAHEHTHRRARARPSIHRQLDRVLAQVLDANDYLRMPTSVDLFGDETSRALFGRERPRVTRAFTGVRGVVLLDGLDLSAPADTVEARAGRLSYAFHRFEHARTILRPQGKDLRKLAVFLGEVQAGSPKDAVRRWAEEKLREDAFVVDAAAATDQIREEAERVGALLPAS